MAHDGVQHAIEELIAPRRWFVGEGNYLRVVHAQPNEEPWEVYLGYLLAPHQTRMSRVLESWNVYLDSDIEAAGPTVSLKLDADSHELHVVRGFASIVWEPYEESPNVIVARETSGWARELVGTVCLDGKTDVAAVAGEIEQLLFLAVVGTSRLPITSIESPLPDFSLGRLHYLSRHLLRSGDAGTQELPATSFDLLDLAFAVDARPVVAAKTLEAALRAAGTGQIGELIARVQSHCAASGGAERLVGLLKDVFHGVALSPYTAFADNFVALLRGLADRPVPGPATIVDLISYLLRQLARHLTAFDLVTFHNQGANYPDALLLDALLKLYLNLIESQPELFAHQTNEHEHKHVLRRRALRQAYFLRRGCEQLAVPDAPTSPGENLRMLPSPHKRVPDEQLADRSKRRRRLFADEPIEAALGKRAQAVLDQSLADLQRSTELRELGMALFLDRPLGAWKSPGAIERTPLLSYEAFSRQIARGRLTTLARWHKAALANCVEALGERLRQMEIAGLPATALPGQERPGVITLEDTLRVAPDFVILRTMRRSLDALIEQYDFSPLAERSPGVFEWLESDPRLLLVRTRDDVASVHNATQLVLFDRAMRRRIELGPIVSSDGTIEYVDVAGSEYLAAGLAIRRYWEEVPGMDDLTPHDVSSEPIHCVPRRGR